MLTDTWSAERGAAGLRAGEGHPDPKTTPGLGSALQRGTQDREHSPQGRKEGLEGTREQTEDAEKGTASGGFAYIHTSSPSHPLEQDGKTAGLLLSPTGSSWQLWGLARVWGGAHHPRIGQQGRSLRFPEVAGIRLPRPQQGQVRYRQENLPREAGTPLEPPGSRSGSVYRCLVWAGTCGHQPPGVTSTAPPAWVSNRAPRALVFTSLLSSRLMLAGLKAATRRHPGSGWKLHSHRSDPRPREHSERRLHLDEKDQCPPVTLMGPLAVHGAGTPTILGTWARSSKGPWHAWQIRVEDGIGISKGQRWRVNGQGQGTLETGQETSSIAGGRLGLGWGWWGALTSRGAHTTHSMGPCEQGRMHSPGAEHRRPREP